MPSQIVQYHMKTHEIALLETEDGSFWIGAYSPHLTHQNGEPMYYFLEECVDKDDGCVKLSEMTGNEFSNMKTTNYSDFIKNAKKWKEVVSYESPTSAWTKEMFKFLEESDGDVKQASKKLVDFRKTKV